MRPGRALRAQPLEGSSGVPSRGWISGATFVDRPIDFSDVDGVAYFEGDIILGRTADLIVEPNGPGGSGSSGGGIGSTTAHSLVITGDRFRWPDATLPYQLDPALSGTMRMRIDSAIEHWEEHTPITFVELDASNMDDFDSHVVFVPHESNAARGSADRVGDRRSTWRPAAAGARSSTRSVTP